MRTVDFEELAIDYSRKRNIPPAELVEVINFINDATNGKNLLLDVGCGTGRISLPLVSAKRPLIAVGLDNSPRMLDALRLASDSISDFMPLRLLQGDFSRSLPFRSSVFDVTLLFQVVHCAPLAQLIPEISRVLTRSGVAVVASTSHDQFPRLAYCANSDILEYERLRTPDTDQIVDAFGLEGFRLFAQKEVAWRRSFASRADVFAWIKSVPFSALTRIGQAGIQELSARVAKQAERIGNKYAVIDDAVRILVFKRQG